MKPLILTLSLAAALVLPSVGRGQTIYQDSFENPRSFAGFTVTTDISQPLPTDAAHASAFVSSPANGDYDFGFTNEDGVAYVVINLAGPNSGGGHSQVNSPESLTLTNSNVGATYQAFTTYTLTYLGAAGGGPATITNTFQANGVNVGDTATGPGGSDHTFAPGATLTFDTHFANSIYVGQTIGFASTVSATLQYDTFSGLDDFVITATPDTFVPEPSSIALMLAGLAFAVALRARVARRA